MTPKGLVRLTGKLHLAQPSVGLWALVVAGALVPSQGRAEVLPCGATVNVATGTTQAGVCYADVQYSVVFPCVTAGGGYNVSLVEGTGEPDPSCTENSCRPGGNLSGSGHSGTSRWVFTYTQRAKFRFTAEGGGPYCNPDGYTCTVDSLPTTVCPGRARASGAIEYHHVDALGSTRLITGGAGEIVSRSDYLPFGEEIPPGQFARDESLFYGGPNKVRQRFTGQIRDDESGLDYFGARYFSGPQGRFMSPDPALTLEANIRDPQRWNGYLYALNSPLLWVDPDGASPLPANLAKGGAGEALAVSRLRAAGHQVVLDAARKAVSAKGVDFVAVVGSEVWVSDNKALKAMTAYAVSAFHPARLAKNIDMAKGELIARLAQGGLTRAEEAAVETAIGALEKNTFKLVVTTAGGNVTRLGPGLVARGVLLRTLAVLGLLGTAANAGAMTLEATTANGAERDWSPEVQRRTPYHYERGTPEAEQAEREHEDRLRQ